MAEYYVYSGASGSNDGSNWANAFTDLKVAMEAPRVAGDIFYVAHHHFAGYGANLTITSPGTDANPQEVYSVNYAGSVPPVEADLRYSNAAQIQTSSGFTITIAGSVLMYGMTLRATGQSLVLGATANRTQRFVKCGLLCNSVTSTHRIVLGTTGTMVILENCAYQFGHASQGFAPAGRIFMRGFSFNPGGGFTPPNGLFISSTSPCHVFAEGLDLSDFTGGGKSLVNVAGTAVGTFVFKDYKLASGVSATSGSFASLGAVDVTALRCDWGDRTYKMDRHNAAGSQVANVQLVRLGGATDGQQPISYQVGGYGATQIAAYELPPISFWNDVVGTPITITIECLKLAAGLPDNGEIWLDVEYFGTSDFPLGSLASNAKGFLAAAVDHDASSSIWSGSGLTPFKMSVTITPQERGPVTIYIKHRTAFNFYIDPQPVIT